MNRRTAALVVALLGAVLVAAVALSGSSSASFVSTTSNGTSTVGAANDWTPPTVSVTSPGSAVSGTVTISATAADERSMIASVEIQYLAPGASAWTTLCTDTTAPYSCSWNTTTVADGEYELRARATDTAGYSALSDTVRTTVANRLTVVLADPGDAVRGSVPLTATVHGAGTLVLTSVRIEYTTAGSTNGWKTACQGLSSPLSCNWTSTAVADGYYDLRAVATFATTTATSTTVTDVLVDNGAPAVTMTNPGTPLRGTVTLAATASDAMSGVAKVDIQYARGTGAFQTACTVTTEPYSCRWDTTKVADGSDYHFRAVATDAAGNATTSTVVTNRQIDNTVSSVSVEDPGAFLTGTVNVAATASSTAGITSVRIQRAVAGSTTWTDICTDTTAPYSCSWDTTTVADGSYDLRAVLLDGRGTTTTSSVVAARRVDNNPLRAVDIQTANTTGTAGRVDAGDSVTFTYSRTINLGSVSPGWNGGSLPVQVRLRDGNVNGVGTGNKGDTLDVLNGNQVLPLGSVNLREDYLKSGRTVTWSATMTAATVTVAGVDRTVITVRVTSVPSGTGLRTVSLASAMVWSPTATVTSSTDGKACSTTPVTETGAADREF